MALTSSFSQVPSKSRPLSAIGGRVSNGSGPPASADPNCSLGRFVSQALSLRVWGEGLRTAEDRGFEPRRVLPPNRISSVFPVVPGRAGNHRDRPEWQVSRAGKAGIVTGPAADARRVTASRVM